MATVAERIIQGNDYVDSHVYALEAHSVNALYGAYHRTYQEMVLALSEAFRQSAGNWNPQQIAARNVLLQQILQAMAVLNAEETDLILTDAMDSLRAGYFGTAWSLDTSLPPADMHGVQAKYLPLLPSEAVRAQVLAPYVGQTFVERLRDNRADFELRIKRALIQSQIQGDTIYQAQKRLAAELGIAIARRTKADRAHNRSAFARTEMIARTELLRASNNGALAVFEANDDVLRGYEIKTALDERTCPTCAALDGKQYAFGQGQRPPFHPRCRCTILPVLINQALEQAIVGKRVTFKQWAASKGLTKNVYGQAFELKARQAPKKPIKEAVSQ